MNNLDIREIAKAQDKLQEITIGKDWKSVNNDYPLASSVEMVEAIDSLGYKWWKKQKIDLENVKVEFIDSLHFTMCAILQLNPSDTSYDFINEWIKENMNNKECDVTKQELIDTCKGVIKHSLDGDLLSTILSILIGLDMLGLTQRDITELYIGKCALNAFRQLNGYKDGTYIKVWKNGKEDNVYMQRIVKELDVVTYDKVLEKLKDEYKEYAI